MNRRGMKHLIGLAALLALLGGAACGNDDGGSDAAGDSDEAQELIDEANEDLEISDEDLAEWCEVADQDEEPSPEELETFVEKAPPEFEEQAQVIADALTSGEFEGPEVEQAAASLDVVIDTHCI